MPDTGAPALLPMEAETCVFFLCNMHRAADVLAVVAESVEELHNKQTPCKRVRRVRFNVQRRPCNPGLGLQVLRVMLEAPHLQMPLIKHHTVPLFETWNALLRIATTLQELLCVSNGNMMVPSVMMLAYELFLLLTYVLHGQQHPVTKEKFVATATLERQMIWMEDSLLSRLRCQSEAQRDLSVQAIKVYLKMARSVFMTNWATFEFAQRLLNFLALCKATEVEPLATEIDLVPPVMRKFMKVFAKSEEQVSAIDKLLEKIEIECPPPPPKEPKRRSSGSRGELLGKVDIECPPPKEPKRRSSGSRGGGGGKAAAEHNSSSSEADSPGRPASR